MDQIARAAATLIREKLHVLHTPTTQVAAELGVSRQLVSRWLNGHSPIPLERAYSLAALCEEPLTDILKQAETAGTSDDKEG